MVRSNSPPRPDSRERTQTGPGEPGTRRSSSEYDVDPPDFPGAEDFPGIGERDDRAARERRHDDEFVLPGPSVGRGRRGLAAMAERLVPAAVRDGRFDIGRRGFIALVIAVALIVAVVGWLAWNGRPTVRNVPDESRAAPTYGDSSSAFTRPTPSVTEVVVAVSGKVRRPGLVRLKPGARVDDAVRAAGGALPGVDLTSVNLARRVVDGEQIVVGLPIPAAPSGQPGTAGTSAAAGSSGGGGPINLNSATVEQLDQLPGIGPTTAKKIIDFRTQVGAFRSVDQLKEVDGIGETRYSRLKDQVTV